MSLFCSIHLCAELIFMLMWQWLWLWTPVVTVILALTVPVVSICQYVMNQYIHTIAYNNISTHRHIHNIISKHQYINISKIAYQCTNMSLHVGNDVTICEDTNAVRRECCVSLSMRQYICILFKVNASVHQYINTLRRQHINLSMNPQPLLLGFGDCIQRAFQASSMQRSLWRAVTRWY